MTKLVLQLRLYLVFAGLLGVLIAVPTPAAETPNQRPPQRHQMGLGQPGIVASQQGQMMIGGSGMPGGAGMPGGPGMPVGNGIPGGTGQGLMNYGSGQSMMGMMGPGMMQMMMSHMMGGPGGMGEILGAMGSGGGKGMDGGMIGRMTYVFEQLGLTPEQWEKVRSLAREKLVKMVDLWAQEIKTEIELSALPWDQEVDPALVKGLFAKKAEAQAEMFLADLAYLQALKAVLTPEQVKRLEGLGE